MTTVAIYGIFHVQVVRIVSNGVTKSGIQLPGQSNAIPIEICTCDMQVWQWLVRDSGVDLEVEIVTDSNRFK